MTPSIPPSLDLANGVEVAHDDPTVIEPLTAVLEVRRRLEARRAEDARYHAVNRAVARERALKSCGQVLALAVLIDVLAAIL